MRDLNRAKLAVVALAKIKEIESAHFDAKWEKRNALRIAKIEFNALTSTRKATASFLQGGAVSPR